MRKCRPVSVDSGWLARGTLDVIPAGDTLDDWLLALRESWVWYRRAHVDEDD